MKSESHLFIDLNRLRHEESEPFDVMLDPQVLELSANDSIEVTEPVHATGTASIVDDELIIDLSVEGTLKMRCSTCHEPFAFAVDVTDDVSTHSLEEIKSATFDVKDIIREAFLLEIPHFPQCGGKSCLNRDKIQKYLKKEGTEDTYSPFKDL